MIKPLNLGNKSFSVNIIQGPLAGYTSAPFRALTWKYSQLAFSCTEMISCKALIMQRSRLANKFHLFKDPKEGPLCFQLFGSDPDDLAEATKIVTDSGADLVDLNCGCSVRKIRKNGEGSSLLDDPAKLYKLICAMKKNTHVPVSIKIRVAKDEESNKQIVNVVSDAGTDFLVVHGRHWSEHYDDPCRHDQIRFFVENLQIPVIGNGDVSDINSLKKMFETGCAGVMIGRAGIGQPWLIGKLIAEVRDEKFNMPDIKEIGDIFIEHVERLVNLFENERSAILQARKITSHYARGLLHKKQRSEFSQAIYSCNNLIEFKKICLNFFV